MDILRWMRRRWVGVKQEGGFDKLEDWALVEIAHGPLLLIMPGLYDIYHLPHRN